MLDELTTRKLLDSVCNEFEKGWSADSRRDFRSYLDQVSAELQEKLLGELIAIDVELRLRSGSSVSPRDYSEFGDKAQSIAQTLIDRQLEIESKSSSQNPSENIATAPQQINNYRIVRRIGHGGMGDVYLAKHVKFEGKRFAIKMLRRALLGNQTSELSSPHRERFENEILAIGRLDHPNIADAYDAGEVDGEPYLVMEFIDGMDVQALLDDQGRLPIPESCEIIRQAAIGLQHASDLGFVHRDIKPSNLMVSKHGVVKVMDLGLAKLHHDSTTRGVTKEGTLLGTPDYISPEQWKDTREVSIRSDIYSLGCVLYCCLGGRPPFRTEQFKSLTSKMSAHLMQPPDDIGKLRSEVPKTIVEIIAKSLHKDPDARFQTPSELANALSSFCVNADLKRLVTPASGQIKDRSHTETKSFIRPFEETNTVTARQQEQTQSTGKLSLAWALGIVGLVLVLGIFWTSWSGYFGSGSNQGYSTNDGGAVRNRLSKMNGGKLGPGRKKSVAEDSHSKHLEIPSANNKTDLKNELLKAVGIYHFRGQDKSNQRPLFQNGSVQEDDDLWIEADFPEPRYLFLFAINPNGVVQLCYPEGDPEPRSLVQEDPVYSMIYPSDAQTSDGQSFPFTDGTGQQAFIFVESFEPLPSFDNWQISVGTSDQEMAAAIADCRGCWVWESNELAPIVLEDKVRGKPRRTNAAKRFEEFCRKLCTPKVQIRGITFPVHSAEKNPSN